MRNRAESVNYKKRIKKCTKMKKNKKEKRAKWSKKTCGLSLKSKNSNCWQIKKTGVIFSQLFRKTVQKIIWKGVLYSGFEGERLSRFFCAKIQENVWIIRMKKEEKRRERYGKSYGNTDGRAELWDGFYSSGSGRNFRICGCDMDYYGRSCTCVHTSCAQPEGWKSGKGTAGAGVGHKLGKWFLWGDYRKRKQKIYPISDHGASFSRGVQHHRAAGI